MKRFGLLNYFPIKGFVNLGDFVQSIAARQFLPHVDEYIYRERLSEYTGQEVSMIMNGWYMTNPEYWPPSDLIDPLFVSFHINYLVENKMLTKKSIDYLKRHEPIGCRDLHTCEVLRSVGIDAFFSGCMTLTLGQAYKRRKDNGKVLFVNVLDEFPSLRDMLIAPRTTLRRIKCGQFIDSFYRNKFMNALFDRELLENAEYFNQTFKVTCQNLFDAADEYLKKLSSAKFVVTSKIHTALPCLAIGVPVVFVNGGLYETANIYRLSGLVDMMNQIIIGRDRSISTNFDIKLPLTEDAIIENPKLHLKYAQDLIDRCRDFVASR